MTSVSRQFALERPIDKVWRVYSDFGVWASWFEMNLLLVMVSYKFAWQGTPAANAPIAVFRNGHPHGVWTARQWDPPLGFHVSGGQPGVDGFEAGLSLTKQTEVSTLIDLKIGADVPFGPIGRFALEWKLDSIIEDTRKRILTEE
jgi:hypothetical protein